MDVTEAFHQRREAAYLADEGDLPASERLLGQVIDALSGGARVPAGHHLNQLCAAVVDRATTLRFANRWEDALADLDRAEGLLAGAPLAIRSSHEPGVAQIRAKLHLNPVASMYDLAAAERQIARLRKLNTLPWAVDDLEADLCARRQEWPRAIELAERVRAELEAQGWGNGVAFVRKRLGLAWLELGRLPEAERELEAAYRQLAEQGPTDVRGELELLLARLRLAQGEPEKAWTLATRALAAQEQLTSRFQSLDDQRRFLTDKLGVHRTAFDIALAGRGPEAILRAWSVAERAKSFYLCQIVRNAEVPLFAGVEPALMARLEGLERAIDLLDRQARDRAEADGGAHRTALYTERQRLLGEVMRANAGWGALRDPTPLEVGRELERLRAEGWVPVSYYFRDGADGSAAMHVFSCASDGSPVHVVEAWSAEELQQLRAARAKLAGEVSQSARLMPRALVAKLLPPSLRAGWPKGAPLLISPHGDAHLVPLHALGREGERLCDERASQYIPTLALLGHARARPAAKALLALGCVTNGFGDPELQDVAPELEGIARAWSARGETTARLMGPEEDLAAVGAPLASWDGYGHLHLSCHGTFPEGRPFDVALRLGKEALRGSELFGTRLSARLVSLSACEVGRHGGGGAPSSDEWLGLYLPLFYAGAGGLLVSLWIADATPARLLMVALHERLARGAPTAAAFFEALSAVKERPAPQWANWYLVGVPFTTEKEP